jgi:hypothetical protein
MKRKGMGKIEKEERRKGTRKKEHRKRGILKS